jgi:hypothetical protein
MLLQQGTFIEMDENVLHRRTPEAELFFVRNTGNRFDNRTFTFNVKTGKPQLWNAYTGKISDANTTENGDVALSLEKDESIFVIFPTHETHYAIPIGATPVGAKHVLPLQTIEQKITGPWRVTFFPKTNEKPFIKTFDKLIDFSRQSDFNVKYFSGTAVYEKTFALPTHTPSNSPEGGECSSPSGRLGGVVILDLGTVYDMAEVEINGKSAGVLWIAPFKIDITDYVKAGNNTLKIKVTNTWQNRLIGDEQFPADFEWITLENNGEPSRNGLPRMNGLPEWVRNHTPRPSKERKTFIPWSYFDKNSELAPAGMKESLSLFLIVNL